MPGRDNVLGHVSFGAGGRACPGARLALLEGESVVTALAERFSLLTKDADYSWESYPGLKALACLPVVCHPSIRDAGRATGRPQGKSWTEDTYPDVLS